MNRDDAIKKIQSMAASRIPLITISSMSSTPVGITMTNKVGPEWWSKE